MIFGWLIIISTTYSALSSPCPSPTLSFPSRLASIPHSLLASVPPSLPPFSQTPADCIQYYYLTKKRENFKHLVRKANLKRKKPFVKPLDYSNSPLSPSSIPSLPLSMFASAKPKIEDAMSADEDSTSFPPGEQMTLKAGNANSFPFLRAEFGDWLEEEISCLKEGLRKYGRAWGKIYREVGRLKTATQCKKFYDEHCTNKQLELSVALAEHSSMKARKEGEWGEWEVGEWGLARRGEEGGSLKEGDEGERSCPRYLRIYGGCSCYRMLRRCVGRRARAASLLLL